MDFALLKSVILCHPGCCSKQAHDTTHLVTVNHHRNALTHLHLPCWTILDVTMATRALAFRICRIMANKYCCPMVTQYQAPVVQVEGETSLECRDSKRAYRVNPRNQCKRKVYALSLAIRVCGGSRPPEQYRTMVSQSRAVDTSQGPEATKHDRVCHIAW